MSKNVFQELDSYFEKFRHYSFKKGEIILHAGDTPSGVYLIKKGFVKLYSTSSTGQELILLLLKPNDFFPTRWAITNQPIEYYIQTMTQVDALRMPTDEFVKLVSNDPELLYEFTKKMLIRLSGLYNRMEYLFFGNASNRIASILLLLTERFGIVTKDTIEIEIPLTHRDIASLVGITRETASLELKKLEQKGIITYKKKRFIIHNKILLYEVSLLEK